MRGLTIYARLPIQEDREYISKTPLIFPEIMHANCYIFTSFTLKFCISSIVIDRASIFSLYTFHTSDNAMF